MPPNAERPRARGANQSRRDDTDSVIRPLAPVKSEPSADPLSMAIRAAVADALAPVIDQLLEATGVRALPRYIDRSELGQMLGVSAPTIRALEAAGLPCVRLGEVRRYSVEAVQQWLATRGHNG